MATVLDSFVIELSLDSNGMAKGAQKAQKSVKNLGDDAKKASEGTKKASSETKKVGEAAKQAGKSGADAFAAFRREAVGALALFTGGKALIGFTKEMTEANTALGNLSKQLDIAPQKLSQMRYAAMDVGGRASSVDSMFSSLQAKGVDNEARANVNNAVQSLGIQAYRPDGHVNENLLDDLAHSKSFQSLTRPMQDAYMSQLQGNTDISNLVTSKDYDKISKKYENKGPTQEDIDRARQLNSDWVQLQAESSKIMQKVYSDIEPTIHSIIQSLIDFEKSHPDAIARGIEGISLALLGMSAILTGKSFITALKFGQKMFGLIDAAAAAAAAERAEAAKAAKNGVGEGTGAGAAAGEGAAATGAGEGAAIGVGEGAAIGVGEGAAIGAGAGLLSASVLLPAIAVLAALWPSSTASNDTMPQPPLGNDNNEDHSRETTTRGAGEKQESIESNYTLERVMGAIAMQESSGDSSAVSGVGAKGLMQLMPGTAKDMGVKNPFNAEESWRGATRYFKILMAHYHDTSKALAAYNWGMGNVDADIRKNGSHWRDRKNLPKETYKYINGVSRNYRTDHVVHHHNNTVTIRVDGSKDPVKTSHAVHEQIANALYDKNLSTHG